MKHQPFVIERTFNVPVSKVWKAITDKDEMKQWYFDLKTFKPEVGFEFQFSAGSEEKQYVHVCEITEVIPQKKLAYSWRYEGYEGLSFVCFELFLEADNSTRLKLTHSGLETFPQIPGFMKEDFAAGWTEIIGTALKNFLGHIN